jgi:hypothetical protein
VSTAPSRRPWLALVLVLAAAGESAALTPSPGATPSALPASPSATARGAAPAATAPPASPAATAPLATTTRARPTATAPVTPEPAPPPPAAEPAAGGGAVAATAVVRPRAFRTPERAAPPAFVPPQAGAPPTGGDEPADVPAPPAGPAAAPRRTSGLVVFRATARTALEGFDLRIAYPASLGSFSAGGQADCQAGTGAIVAANDRSGELRLLVASAQPLPFPLDVFCRFTTAPGAGLDAGAFDVRVAEVTSDAKRADPSLLIVNVVVR